MIPIAAEIEQVKQAFRAALEAAATEESLEKVRVLFLSRHGEIARLMLLLKQLPLEEKKQVGPLLNDMRSFAQAAFDRKQASFAQEQLRVREQQEQFFDVTALRDTHTRGSIHVYSQIIAQLEDIFISMGYTIGDGPEIETEFYNFDALNIPENHPARDAHDTFWLTIPSLLLRTHTSPVQIRYLEKKEFPLAICTTGRVYRNEATDASHNFMFTQIEGLFIDKEVSMANLIATVETFLQAVFEKKDLRVRARPSYFPFVEPGIEIDCSCPFCASGCSVCKRTGWIELMGAGLVHPNVLTRCGIDAHTYTGFAFGLGIDRLAMIKYGINDIRLFQSPQIRVLEQF